MIRHQDIIADQTDPFANCKLQRKGNAGVLSSIVDSYASGFVLAINGEWGTGKTTFVKMWQKQLENSGHKTIYFNAWENDFVSEPMVGILGELKTLTETPSETRFTNILKKASKYSLKIIPALVKGIAKKHFGDEVVDVCEKMAEATTDVFSDEINDYEEKKKNLTELKKELAEFVKEKCGDKPLVFIVDELDRCRPDYAVEVLEKIKHFFSVPGIVFVLSIDKEQLSNSIRGYYGSDRINANEYLRRFIDIEYALPEPNTEDFCRYLYDYFGFVKFLKYDEGLVGFASKLSKSKFLSLRQIEKLFAHTRLTIRAFQNNQYVIPDMIFFLIYCREYEPQLYNDIQSKSLTSEALMNKFELVFGEQVRKEESRYLEYVISRILVFYHNLRYESGIEQAQLWIQEEGNWKLGFELKYFSPENIFNGCNSVYRDHYMKDMPIDFFTKKINLLDNIVSQ